MILDLLRSYRDYLLDTYSTSAASLIEWLSFCSLSALAGDAISALGTTLSNHDHRTVLTPIQREASSRGYTELGDILIKLIAPDPGDTPSWIQQCRDCLNSFIDDIAYDTLIGYMRSTAKAYNMPYEFEATWQVSQSTISSVVRTKLMETLAYICRVRGRNRPLAVTHIDIMVDTILYLLQTGQESFDVEVGRAIVLYVSQRKQGKELKRGLARCDPNRLGSLLTKYLSDATGNLTNHTLYAIWELCAHSPELVVFNENTLTAVHAAPRFFISLSLPCSNLISSEPPMNTPQTKSPS
jgi:hypothetical protein